MNTRKNSERGVSAVIGVILMVAITITLLVAVAPVVLGMTGSVETSEPRTSFVFTYNETVDASTDDSFGTNGTGDGMLAITLQGNSVDADRLKVVGAASEGTFAESDVFGTDSEVNVGDSINVWTSRGETVRIIWTSSDEEQTQVLGEFSVDDSEAVRPYTPWPPVDHDCEWVDSEVGAGGDLTIDGVVVECNLDDYPVQNLEIINNGALVGDANHTGTLTMSDGETYDGSVNSGSGGIDIDTDSTINGDVTSDGSFQADASVVNGDVDAVGVVDLDSTGTGAIVNGDVDTDSDVDLESDTEVDGQITAAGNVNLGNDALVTGTVTSTGSGTVTLGDDATIDGRVSTDGDVDLQTNAVVTSDVTADSISCASGAMINGEPCSDYAAPYYAVSIDSANDPVEEGSTLDVTATIENTGINQGDQTVTLDIDGFQNDSSSHQIDGGDSETTTLSWSTSTGDKGTYTATVNSDDESTSTAVEVSDQNLASLTVHSFTVADTDENDDFQQDIEVEETDNASTNNFAVMLAVDDTDGNEVYNQTVADREIKNETTTVTFGADDGTTNLGTFSPGTGYTATATAWADNAPEDTGTDTFDITEDNDAAKVTANFASGGTTQPSVEFQTSEPVEMASLSLETKGSFSTTNEGKGKGDRFEVGSDKTQQADDSSGNFAYDFKSTQTYDGTHTVTFNQMDSNTGSLSLVGDESNADLVIGILMNDGSEKYFYIDE